MVPVGGSIIYSPVLNKKENFIEIINNLYPGRASGAPIIDLFITFLEMGEINLRLLLKERKLNFQYLKT
jgi:O-phospho-L-seryl-tRNASec:L-selenocysteinyl-tRNA synthase